MNQAPRSEPILAIATAPGKGGVGVVRVSFPEGGQFVAFQEAALGRVPSARLATFIRVRDADGLLLDEGLALSFPAPSSYTGEHVLEFQGHGGSGVLQALVGRFIEVGRALGIPVRHARPGEFTERAFLNDKLDLAQAEAVADLIDATTQGAVKAAAASLTGVFSDQVNQLAERITHLRLLLEATLDFPEEEIDFLEKADAKGQLQAIVSQHLSLMSAATEGVRFRDGVKVVLVGQPNVGKSSLLNALAGQDVAIVTDVAGTTRDRIQQDLNIRGIPLTVIDTAGLRSTSDAVEKIGIERTLQSIQEADLVIHLLDARTPSDQADLSVWNQIPEALELLKVYNKADLLSEPRSGLPDGGPFVSARTGQGLETLKDRVLDLIGVHSSPDHGFMARQRHLDALKQCETHLHHAREYAQQDDRILDLFAEELRLAHDALGEITGKLLPDDLLGLIFSRFCIGK